MFQDQVSGEVEIEGVWNCEVMNGWRLLLKHKLWIDQLIIKLYNLKHTK